MNNYLQAIANTPVTRENGKEWIGESLSTIQPYQREEISLFDKIRIVNDSRATSLDAAWFALSGCDKSVIWIVGSLLGDAYYLQAAHMREQYKKVKALIVLTEGDTNCFKWHRLVADVPIIIHSNQNNLIQTVNLFLNKKDTILFSPAAPSFDLFDNYVERGKWFHEQILHRL